MTKFRAAYIVGYKSLPNMPLAVRNELGSTRTTRILNYESSAASVFDESYTVSYGRRLTFGEGNQPPFGLRQ